jgi:hypothetical protein
MMSDEFLKRILMRVLFPAVIFVFDTRFSISKVEFLSRTK